VFWLIDPGRIQSWKVVNRYHPDIHRDLVSCISQYFSPGDRSGDPPQRALDRFSRLAGATFDLEDLLRQQGLGQNELLAISTLATGIPWDLLPFDGGSLGEKLNIGLTIPAPPPTRYRQRAVESGPARRPQFLHVVANPRGDLRAAAEEAAAIQSLVQQQAELDYELIDNPTVGELLKLLGACARPTPYFHFTGHIMPSHGLELRGGRMSYEEIMRFFPGTSEQIVMLNGCDALWEREAIILDDDAEASWSSSAELGGADMFQTAAVAQAFLDAGTGAVIAPRSSISDTDAMCAAKIAWERVFAGDSLGSVVRQVRYRLSEVDCAVQSRHSYILYGAPSTRVRPRATVPNAKVKAAIDYGANETLLKEACGDAGGAAEPRHIFAALSRRWIVGQAYFEREGNRYIETLESLRMALRVSALPPSSARIELSPAAQKMVESIGEHPQEPVAANLSLLESLTTINDPEVQCALESAHRGPRRLEQLLQLSRGWKVAGAKSERAAFDPDGFANFHVLAPNLFSHGATTRDGQEVQPGSIDVWDLFIALILAGGNTTEAWKMAGPSLSALPVPSAGAWRPARPLHWRALTASLQEVMTNAFSMSLDENCEVIGEGHLVRSMASDEAITWNKLPTSAHNWLAFNRMNAKLWEEFGSRLGTESLSWL
jgi:hypothetical protein